MGGWGFMIRDGSRVGVRMCEGGAGESQVKKSNGLELKS